MNTLSQIKVKDDPGPFKRAEDRWKPYLDDLGSASAFAGTVLTHSDWTPDNVLVSEHRAWLIDWAWPTLGAAWTDPAHIDLFAAANVRLWDEIAQPGTSAWTGKMAQAAHAWAAYRHAR